MNFYSDMAATADNLLKQFGSPRTIVLTREMPTGDAHNPGEPITKDYDVTAVVLNKWMDGAEGGRMVIESKRHLVMSANQPSGAAIPITPATGDITTFDGFDWNVESAVPISPGGITIIYRLDVTK